MGANNTELFEALLAIKREIDCYCDDGMSAARRMTEDPPDYTCLRDSIIEIDQIVNAALAKPPRACDVMSQEDLTRVVISGFMKSLEARPEFNIVGAKALVEATISAAIKCAYDTQLVSKVEGGEK